VAPANANGSPDRRSEMPGVTRLSGFSVWNRRDRAAGLLGGGVGIDPDLGHNARPARCGGEVAEPEGRRLAATSLMAIGFSLSAKVLIAKVGKRRFRL
jgi:hypothetical protein